MTNEENTTATTGEQTDPLGLASIDRDDLRGLFDLDRIYNLRDVGGLPIPPADVVGPAGSASPSGRVPGGGSATIAVDGGSIRTGRVFRSAQLGDPTDISLAQLGELSLDVVFDLRSDTEADVMPDFAPAGVELAHRDILADSEERLATILNDLDSAEEALHDGAIQQHYITTYRNLVTLPSAISGYTDLFTAVAEGRSVLFHCTAGKDRTGWGAAALQLLLGASYEAVSAHYLASNSETVELFSGVIDALSRLGVDAGLIAPAFMVERMYLDAAIDEMMERFGTIERYFTDGLGLDGSAIDEIRHQLIDD